MVELVERWSVKCVKFQLEVVAFGGAAGVSRERVG